MIQVEGLGEVINNLTRLEDQYKKGLKKAIATATLETESKAKQRAPVDTGRLRSSISSSFKGDDTGQVSVNVSYAPYMEFGTGNNVDFSYITNTAIRREAEIGASQFRGQGIRNVNIVGYKYLLSSFLEARTHFYQFINRFIK